MLVRLAGAVLLATLVASCALVAGPKTDGPLGAPNDPGAPSAARVYLTSNPPTLDVPVEIGLRLAVSEDPAPTYPFAANDLIRVIADVVPGTYRVSLDGTWCDGSITLASSRETDVRLDVADDGCVVSFGEPHPIGGEHTIE